MITKAQKLLNLMEQDDEDSILLMCPECDYEMIMDAGDFEEMDDVILCPKCEFPMNTVAYDDMDYEEEEYCNIELKNDLSEKKVKVIRDGKVVIKDIKIKKKKLSPKQKAALAKARKKSSQWCCHEKTSKINKTKRKKRTLIAGFN